MEHCEIRVAQLQVVDLLPSMQCTCMQLDLQLSCPIGEAACVVSEIQG